MLFKSQILTQASGSIGGITASHNRGGMYFRSRSIPVDPSTAPQGQVRAAMGALVNRWINTLTPEERTAWNTYAANVPLTGPLGDPVIVSGMNMYVRSNVARIQVITPIIDVAPPVFNTGTLSAVLIDNASAAVQQVDITFDGFDAWDQPGGHLIIQQSRPVNPTINFFQGPYRFMGSVNGIAASPITLPVVFPFLEGQRLFFRVRASLPDGRMTQVQFLGPLLAIA